MTINRWRLYAELAAIMGLAALLSLSILTTPASRHKGSSGVSTFHPSYPGQLQMPTWATLNGVPDHQATEDVALLGGPPPPSNPCGSYTVTYNSYIYDDGDAWPWYGANGNYADYPVTENQTPAGQPGYGDGPYQNFTVCEISGTEALIYSTAISAWVGEPGTVAYAQSPGDEYWNYTCVTPGHSLELSNFSNGYAQGAVSVTGYTPLAMGARVSTGDNYLIHGLCGA